MSGTSSVEGGQGGVAIADRGAALSGVQTAMYEERFPLTRPEVSRDIQAKCGQNPQVPEPILYLMVSIGISTANRQKLKVAGMEVRMGLAWVLLGGDRTHENSVRPRIGS